MVLNDARVYFSITERRLFASKIARENLKIKGRLMYVVLELAPLMKGVQQLSRKRGIG